MWASLVCVALISAPRATVETVDGRTLRGDLTQLTAETVELKDAAAGATSLPAKDVLNISFERSARSGASKPVGQARLMDGSSINIEKARATESEVTLQRAGQSELRLPVKAVSSLRFPSAGLDEAWERIVGGDHAGDILVVRGAGAIDFLEGIIGEATDDAVQFTTDGETISVKWPKIEGWKYFRQIAKAPKTACTVVAGDGSRYAAESVSLQGDALALRGADWSFEVPLGNVSELDFTDGKTTRLGSLTPESVKWTPFYSGGEPLSFVRKYYEPKIDRAMTGPLSLDGKTYSQGVCIHSRTEIVYRLPDDVSAFHAIAGIDDGARGRGAVKLSISADNSPLFDEVIRGGEPARKLSLNIEGARRLKIVVDFGPGRDEADYLDLCNARIVK